MRRFNRIFTGVALLGLVTLLGTSGAAAHRVDQGPSVMAVDAAGRAIGLVLKMDFSLETMQVAFEVNGAVVPLLVRKSSFSHGSRPIVYYESADCTGPAHLGAGAEKSSLGPPIGVAGPRGTLYWGYPELQQNREIRSAMWGSECPPFEGAIEVIDADPILDLADEFTPPFGIGPGNGDAPGDPSRGKGPSRARE